MATAADLIAQADRAAAAGDLKRAEELLGEAAQIQADDAGLLLKLAAIQRGTGQPALALETIHRALVIEPRDFTALLMRASLLDRLELEEARRSLGARHCSKAGRRPSTGLGSSHRPR